MPPSYPIPAATVEVVSEVKKSRFIARALPCASREQALALIATARSDFPDARHHCWAYQLGDPAAPHSAAMNDDGEPSGTAGKPILNVIGHRGVGDLLVIVIRYFGGIKLGAGGLVRAYGQAAAQAIDALTLIQAQPQFETQVRAPFALEQSIRHWLAQHQGEVVELHYAQQVTLSLKLPEQHAAAWSGFCAQYGLQERGV